MAIGLGHYLTVAAILFTLGIVGIFIRRAFYRLTLEHCAGSFSIGFGAVFSHRQARVEHDAYVGPYAIVGSCRLGRGCLIGSRSSILSGASSPLRGFPSRVSQSRARSSVNTGSSSASV